jgi:hypothetical protein
MDFGETLDRLVKPLNDALDYTGIRTLFPGADHFFKINISHDTR